MESFRFKQIFRRGVNLFTGEAPKLHFKRTFTNVEAVTRTCFRHNLTCASLAGFSKTCQIHMSDVVVESKLLVSGKNELDFHWLFIHFRKSDQAQLISGRSVIS